MINLIINVNKNVPSFMNARKTKNHIESDAKRIAL